MKSIFFTALSILAIFSIVPALAEPLPILEPRASPNAEKVIAYIKDTTHSADISPACFYSGRTNVTVIIQGKPYTSVEKAEVEINTFKVARKCHVITDIVEKAKVNPSDFVPQDWKDVSEAFAQTVKGTAYVLLGKSVLQTSVWLNQEKPALKKNKAVTKVEVWEIETDGKIKKTGYLTKATS